VYLARKLAEWQEAGLLSADAAAAILAHETRQSRPYALYILGGLGALTIALGLVAIVASNWEAIPGGVKLAFDLLLAAALAAGVLAVDRRGIDWLRESLIGLYAGFVLASIGLVSQVYHLGGATWQAMLLWTGLTAPLVTRARGSGLATAWIIGLHITYYLVLVALFEHRSDAEALGLGLAGLPPLLCLAVASSPGVTRSRPGFARAFASIGWGEGLVMASGATFAWYDQPFRTDRDGLLIAAAIALGITGLVAARAPALARGHAAAVSPIRALLVLITLIGYGSLAFGADDLDLVGALAFLILWGGVAWVGLATHDSRLVSSATALLGIRLIVIYFEVFGSLLDTGLGLITGGLLTIGLTWLWARKRRDLTAHFAEGPHR